MLGSYRSIIIAVAGLALLSGGVWYGLDQESLYRQESDQRHADYSRRAADQIQRACGATALAQKPNCIKEAVSEYRLKQRDNQREYEDLVAQKTSALWTSLMGVAALIGMFLSAVGVALVYTTFSEAKKTNRIAMRESARATRRAVSSATETTQALAIAARNADAAVTASVASVKYAELFEKASAERSRPYVIFDCVEMSGFNGEVDGAEVLDGLMFTIRIKNAGATPAIKALMPGGVGIITGFLASPPTFERPNLIGKEGRTTLGQGWAGGINPFVVSHAIKERFAAREIAIYLYAYGTYASISRPDHFYTIEVCVRNRFAGFYDENGASTMRIESTVVGPQNGMT